MIIIDALVRLKRRCEGRNSSSAKAIALKWDDPQPWEIWGEAWRMLGQWRKAAQCWEEVLRRNPFSSRACLALVDLYDRLQEGTALRRNAARCLALKGDESLDEWLEGLARDSSASAYEIKPRVLRQIIQKEIRRDLLR